MQPARRAVLLAMLLAAVATCGQLAAVQAQPNPFAPVKDAPTNAGLKPVKWEKFGRAHYYQIPDDPVGTVVTFHGCARYSKAFFPWDPQDCPECLGFPEHVSQTKQALALGYALLALDPADFRHLCWSSAGNKPGYQSDQPTVLEMLDEWLPAAGLEDKPVILLGISSGGTLALKLAAALARDEEQGKGRRWKVAGVISEESVPESFNAADDKGRLLYRNFPPSFFVCMEGGNSRYQAPKTVVFLREGGVPGEFVVSPVRKVTPSYLSDRIPTITRRQSQLIRRGLLDIGAIDSEGLLLGDPERNRIVLRNKTSPALHWEVKLQRALPWMKPKSPTLSLVYRQCSIQQALNVAYARHDAISDYMTVGLKWIESGGKAELQPLVDRYTVPKYNLTALTMWRAPPGGMAGEGQPPLSPPPEAPPPAGAPAGAPVAAPGGAVALQEGAPTAQAR